MPSSDPGKPKSSKLGARKAAGKLGARKPAARKPGARKPAARKPTARKRSTAAEPQPLLRGGFVEPVRDSLRVMARLTGIERVARAMERFALAADRAADVLDQIDAKRLDDLITAAERTTRMLDRIEREFTVENAVDVLDRLRSLADTADQMNRSLRAIEQLATETRRLITSPLARLPFPGRARPSESPPDR
jgi:hypothetical protein